MKDNSVLHPSIDLSEANVKAVATALLMNPDCVDAAMLLLALRVRVNELERERDEAREVAAWWRNEAEQDMGKRHRTILPWEVKP